MSHFILLSLLACVATLNCFGEQPAAKANPKPPPPTVVPLVVTVNDTQTYGPPSPGSITTNIQSDGRGSYTDGVDGVCASLDSSGNLTVDLECSASANPRVLYVFGVAPVPLAPPTNGSYGCAVPNLANAQHLNHFQAFSATNVSSPAFQNMTVDATGNTTYQLQIMVATALINDPNDTAFRVNFQGAQVFTDALKTSYAVVRRLSATQWNVEPVSASTLPGNPVNAGILVQQTTTRHRTTITECGFYQIPFSFTLTAK